MRILYLGEDSSKSTSRHRMDALIRLGNDVSVLNPKSFVSKRLSNAILNKFHYSTGYYFLQSQVKRGVQSVLNELKSAPELVWVNSGELIGPKVVQTLKKLGCPVILYNNDDPTGRRDGNRFRSLLRSLKYYDLCVVRYEKSDEELRRYGARKILKVYMSYDEVCHKSKYSNREDVPSEFQSEVAFIGTWIPNEGRDIFIKDLLDNGVPISVWGDGWEKSPSYNSIASAIRGKSIYGEDYVSAVQGAKICLGLLSKANRDLHTRRSVEIPFIGSILCAEKTDLHSDMYNDGEEAVFWESSLECSSICKAILSNKEKMDAIRIAGMDKVRLLKAGNEDICLKILETVNRSFN